jgi:uncharacterized membrane protein
MGAMTVGCVGVIVNYLLIAVDWRRRARDCHSVEGRLALNDISQVFIWCSACGYGFRILMTFIPVWLFYLVGLVWLNAVAIRYRYRVRNLDIVYEQLDVAEGILNGRYAHLKTADEKLAAIQADLRAIRGINRPDSRSQRSESSHSRQ